MKKLLVSSLLCLAVLFGTAISGQCADVTLNLKAQWNASPESDLSGYYFWGTAPRTAEPLKGFNYPANTWQADNVRGSKIDKTLTTVNFTTPVIDDTVPTGAIYYSMEAVDIVGNISAKCANVQYNFNVDSTPPAPPTGLTISKQ